MTPTEVADAIQPVPDERRRGRRFGLHLSCRIHCSSRAEVGGLTEDISRSGLRVAFTGQDSVPAVGEQVRIVIDLPSSPEISPRCLECAAEAVRAPRDDAHHTVAFRMLRWWIRDAQEHPETGSGH